MALYCGSSVSFENEDSIAIYKSWYWAEGAFCKYCGSHVFYRFPGNQYLILTRVDVAEKWDWLTQ